jgi:hypothetical protein
MRRLILNHTMPEVDKLVFRYCDWTDFYGNVIKEDPPNKPVPLGNPVQKSCFVDADHAGNKVTRQLHTGVFILLNNTPVIAFSKRQNTCESSTYGSELVAM